jgi:SpoVK/Ycf46/Vps4 family AAA+-type ATPase
MEHFTIIQALCRSALSNPSNAIIHQIERLRDALEKDGNKKEAKSLDGLLQSSSKSIDMAPSNIQRSFIIGGEELTQRTPIPVDKESSTPLAEIIFTNKLPFESPIFDDNVKLALESVLNEWKNYEKLSGIQADPSRSCLIYGAPGTGKTHLALWIAQQINIPVVLAKLDGLMSSFLGTSSRNIGNLFAFAARYKCILLLDEFDAIAKLRNDPQEVGEIKRVVNTLLQSLDTREKSGFTIGVTNHESLLDPAIWRRFNVQIEIPKPSSNVIKLLIEKFLAPLSLDKTEIKFLSWAIENASGADVESLIRWLKKSYVLDEGISLANMVRRFAVLNSGRVDATKRIILSGTDNDLISSLLKDKNFDFSQKDIASLLGKSQSTLSKQLSKNK